MVEQITTQVYRIEIPLPEMTLKSVNSYVITGEDRNLIVDPGMGSTECMEALRAGLQEIGIGLQRTDFFITHFHIDHFGLAPLVVDDASTIYMHAAERAIIERITTGSLFPELADASRMNGFPEGELQEALSFFRPLDVHTWKRPSPFTLVHDGDILSIGEYRFTCILTPGHTRGHMCLYEPHKKILVSGDHLLNEITPVVSARFEGENPLKDYLASLQRIYLLDTDRVLPGHKDIFRNGKERIRELNDHHQKRAREVLSILERGMKHAYDVASEMTWDIEFDTWDSLPAIQKFFAIGEAIAHLEYLVDTGAIRKAMCGNTVVYVKNKTVQ